ETTPMKRHLAWLLLGAVPLTMVGYAYAQPRLKDRVQPSGRFGAGASAGPASAAPAATPTTAPANTGQGTGGGTTTAPATTTTSTTAGGKPTPPMIGPGGKAQGDTKDLAQFENAIEYEPRSPNYRVAFS